MTAQRKVIDVEAVTDLTRLVDEIRDTQEAHVLRRRGVEVALILPAKSLARRRRKRILTDADLDELRSLAGRWKDRLDVDTFLAEIYAARDVDDRPPVEL